jgi:acetyl-CoA carboxylase biotin carboxyl carrier protein
MAGKKKPNPPAPAGLAWNEIERVLKLMAKHGLEEFEYSDGAMQVRLKKASGNPHATIAPADSAIPSTAPESPAPTPPSAPPAALPAQPPEEKLHIVKSPIVGTYYAAPNPGAPPFVQVGDPISVGQVLCIIEAMKLMNEIESDVAGEIARILVENGQPVEYGEPLFAIRPAAKLARTA